MRLKPHSSNGLVRARAEPHPGWLLLWFPVLLIALDASPDLGAAMVRLAAVLLLGMVAWGMGRGPAGHLAERGFAALLLVAWFAVCGTAFRLHGVPASIVARLAVTAGLLLGPVFLLWAWRRRASMVPVVDDAGLVAEPGSAGALVRALVLVGVALVALDWLLGLRPADLLVVGTGLALYATFRVQGRHRTFGVLG
jgi:hypothetical protein